MRSIVVLLTVLLLTFSSAVAQSSDTLLDVRQWAVASGGNDHFYGIIPIVQPWIYQSALAQTLTYSGQPGNLASIQSAAENSFIESLIADHTNQPSITDEFYIGGLKMGGVWRWLSGGLFAYTNWASGEPSGDGPAIAIWGMSQGSKAGTWNDVPEDTVGHSTDQQLWAIVEFGPSDGSDTLINLTQWAVADGGNDHWYAVLANEHFWVDADFLAGLYVQGGEVGYLATITSPEENQFILDNLVAGTSQPSILDEFWLGGVLDDSSFIWQSGELFAYSNWASGEPNNLPDESVMAMWGFNEPGKIPGSWNNALPDDAIHDLHQWWSIIEFGPFEAPPVDTLLDVRQWTVAEGGNDHYYGIIQIVQPWVNHLALATTLTYDDQPGYLATVRSPAENAFVESLIFDHPNQPSVADEFFIGGSEVPGPWHWETGELFSYAHWASGEPNGDGHAMAIWGSSIGSRAGYWNDAPEDTTGYGTYPQLWAVVEFGPLDVDVIDTLIDVRQWSSLDGGNDHYYGIISIVQPWVDQRDLAQTLVYDTESGYLATIGSVEENTFLESLMADHTDQPSVTDEFYIGGSMSTGVWKWLSGEPFDYARWEPGEPSGDGTSMAIWGMSQGYKAGYWNDVPADSAGYGWTQQLWALVEFGGPCCQGLTGNINDDIAGQVNLTDLTMLVNHLFITFEPLPCCAAANVSGDAGCVISLTDVTLLVNHLFVTFELLAPCNSACE